jgi:hypothetical protein
MRSLNFQARDRIPFYLPIARQPGIKKWITISLTISLLMGSSVGWSQSPPNPPVMLALDGQSNFIHDFTALPLTADGWTDLDAMITSSGYSDSRIMYVAADGNDSTGHVYTQAQINALGGTPTNPTSAVQAFATIAGAFEHVRSGYPDVVLLRRGDEWSGGITVNKSGRTKQQRMVISAYGPPATARPVLWGTGVIFRLQGVEYAYVGDVRIDRIDPPADDTETAINSPGNVKDVVIEGIRIDNYGTYALSLSPDSDSYTNENIVVRRCVIDNTRSGSAYISNQYNILLEENTVDRTGVRWLEVNAGGGVMPQTWYIQKDNFTPVTFRKNIMARTAGYGFQTRIDGDYSDNLMVQTPMPVTLGQEQASKALNITSNRNLILDANNIIGNTASEPPTVTERAWGFFIEGGSVDRGGAEWGFDSLEINDNIIAQKFLENGTGIHLAARSHINNPGSEIRRNIVYGWYQPLRLGDSNHANLTIADNLFHANTGPAARATTTSTPSAAMLRGNTYYSAAPESGGMFELSSGATDYAGWQAVMDDTGGTVALSDAGIWDTAFGSEPTIAAYQQWIGATPTMEAWIEAVKAQRRGAWDPRYTAQAVYEWAAKGFGR